MVYMEFKAGQKYPSVDAEISDTLDGFIDAGYVIEDNDLIIDIDCLDKTKIEKLMTVFNIKTHTVLTDRGVHFYFNRPDSFTRGANRVCSLGFPIELKHNGNTKAITVKRNGVEREVLNKGIRQDVPTIFKISKRFDNLLGIDDGEGRNQALFKLRNQLANVDGWQNILRFVNNDIFATPLPEEEFQTIIRDVTVEAEKDNEPLVAEYLMNKHKMVKYMGKVYFRVNGSYITDEEKLLRLIFDKTGPQKTRYIDEVRKQIEYRCKIIDNETIFDIKFNNGILRDGEFIEIETEEFTPYVLDVDYVPNAEPIEMVDDYIDHLTQSCPDYQKLIYEILGHCFIVDPEKKRQLAKFFIFIGGGGNGKGTLLQIIKKILGRDNCTALSVDNLADERYLVNVKGKLANLGDDIQDAPIDNKQMEQLKKISTCDTAETRELYKQSSTTTMTASLIFTSNHMLKTFEKGDSYKRRVMWLPMFTVVDEKKKDGKFITKLTTKEAIEYWISRIMEGYFRLYKNNCFTESRIVREYNIHYHKENNNTEMFLDDYIATDIENLKPPELYEEYEIWAEDNGYNVASKKMLMEGVSKKFNLYPKAKRVGGKTKRVYAFE